MYQALYRVWRPQTFSDMVGQTAIVRTLRNQVRLGRTAHAYLFCGSRGTGKTSAAKIMARAVNCEHPNDGDPCGQCMSCQSILSGASMDVVEMDAASNSGVDQIRDLLEKVDYPPQFGRFKVYIIDEVHMLSAAAFNALLKTIEEPPAYMIFILATTEPQKVPATILSRCQRFDFGRFTMEELIGRMKLAAQGQPVTEEAYTLIAQSAEGGMRDALSLLDMCLGMGGEVTEESVRLVLGAADSQILFDLADHIAAGDAAAAMTTIDRLYSMGSDVTVFLRDFGRHMRYLTTARLCGAAALTGMSAERAERYAKQAEMFSAQKLMRVMEYILHAESDTRWASSPRSVLEMAVLRACDPPEGQDVTALLERIDTLETRLKAIESGAVAVCASGAPAQQPAASGTSDKQPAAAGSVPAQPAPPASEAEVWKRTVAKVKAEQAQLSFIQRGRFQGVRDGAYTVAFQPQDEFYLTLLDNDRSRRIIGDALLACGAETGQVRVELLRDKAAEQRQIQSEQSMQTLFDTFGRDAVQVSDK